MRHASAFSCAYTARGMHMVQERFNILLPDKLKAQLQEDAKEQGVSASKLISKYIAEHYATSDVFERLDVFEQECTTLREQLEGERTQAVQKAQLHRM